MSEFCESALGGSTATQNTTLYIRADDYRLGTEFYARALLSSTLKNHPPKEAPYLFFEITELAQDRKRQFMLLAFCAMVQNSMFHVVLSRASSLCMQKS